MIFTVDICWCVLCLNGFYFPDWLGFHLLWCISILSIWYSMCFLKTIYICCIYVWKTQYLIVHTFSNSVPFNIFGTCYNNCVYHEMVPCKLIHDSNCNYKFENLKPDRTNICKFLVWNSRTVIRRFSRSELVIVLV